MYLNLHTTLVLKKSKNPLKLDKRNFTSKTFSYNLIEKTFLAKTPAYTEILVPETSITLNSCNSSWWSNFSNLPLNLPEFLNVFNSLFSSSNIEKVSPLISDFYYENMIKNFKFIVSQITSYKAFEFKPGCFSSDQFLLDTYVSLLSNKFIQVLLLSIIVKLMQTVSEFVCSTDKGIIFFYFCNKINLFEENQGSYFTYDKTTNWFISIYSYVISLGNWISIYFYKYSYEKFYYDILYRVYANIKHLMVKYYFNFNFSYTVVGSQWFKNKSIVILSFSFNIVLLASQSLNIMYSGLTVIYIILGWLLDYLSCIWLTSDSRLKFKYIFTISFWLKRSSYAINYMLWLYLGVFSTNGIFFCFVGNVIPTKIFNLLIFAVGGITSLIASNLWFFYGNPRIHSGLHIWRLTLDDLIYPILLKSDYSFSRFLRSFINSIISPIEFNTYTSFRRAVIEWVSFLAMVYSTYGSWNLYMSSIFYSLSIMQNFVIWTVPYFVFGFGLIYLEDLRPRFSYYYYGLFYMLFWTSVCFATNTILVGYINMDNAAYACLYLIPINFLLAFMYPLPLYRYNLESTLFDRLLHLLLFAFLTATTLISAGTIWTLIGSV